MDSPDDGNENAVQSDSENSSSEESNPRRKAHTSEKNQKTEWTQGFACMQKYDPEVNEKSPNSGTIDILQQMLDCAKKNVDCMEVYNKGLAVSLKPCVHSLDLECNLQSPECHSTSCEKALIRIQL